MDNETHMEEWRAQTFDSYQVLVDIGIPVKSALQEVERAQFPPVK